jgi:hypothetical protein
MAIRHSIITSIALIFVTAFENQPVRADEAMRGTSNDDWQGGKGGACLAAVKDTRRLPWARCITVI